MAQIIPFPVAERIEVWSGTDKASGMPVTVLDFVGKDGRFGASWFCTCEGIAVLSRLAR